MILVHVYISPKGVHQTKLETYINEDLKARQFYARLKPLLCDLDRAIAESHKAEEGRSNEIFQN